MISACTPHYHPLFLQLGRAPTEQGRGGWAGLRSQHSQESRSLGTGDAFTFHGLPRPEQVPAPGSPTGESSVKAFPDSRAPPYCPTQAQAPLFHSQRLLWLNYDPPKPPISYVEVLTPIHQTVTISGVGSPRGKYVKMRSRGWALIQHDQRLYKEEEVGGWAQTYAEEGL